MRGPCTRCPCGSYISQLQCKRVTFTPPSANKNGDGYITKLGFSSLREITSFFVLDNLQDLSDNRQTHEILPRNRKSYGK